MIQEELVKDFANNSQLSDWFGREEAEPPAVVVRKANPKNVQNTEKIKELEEQIQRYVAGEGNPSQTEIGTNPPNDAYIDYNVKDMH